MIEVITVKNIGVEDQHVVQLKRLLQQCGLPNSHVVPWSQLLVAVRHVVVSLREQGRGMGTWFSWGEFDKSQGGTRTRQVRVPQRSNRSPMHRSCNTQTCS
eukprot:NODE_4661_length_1134_cov_43.420376_g4138_i0.p1 GENE.NODE_4661_length_1134_cov_43.420376_g4138_i0~~NODE_4661_length_1134_cov_43.420376_g4138_i0.p1  ORF type:complete len:101 (-),score=14.84 NODE_4661_length_1134_cov_43.420376_g4138_i0:757-1059(-)